MEKLIPHKDEDTGRWRMEGVEPSQVTFAKMCNMIKNNINFKFARYGDGEFNCMFRNNAKKANCDGHEYFEDLGERLLNSFSKEVMTGIQPLALTLPYADKIYEKIEGLTIYNSDALHNASIDLQLSRFVQAIIDSERELIIVGPQHLRKLFQESIYIFIPDKNCWTEYEAVKSALNHYLNGKKNKIVLLCASMMSEVLIYDYKDSENTFIDAGSVFDPFCGVYSRSYHHKLQIV